MFIKNVHFNANSTNGVINIFGREYFFKVLPDPLFHKEIRGWHFLKKYFPVAQLVTDFHLTPNRGIMLFEYEKSIQQGKGLLFDPLHHGHLTKHAKALFELLGFTFAQNIKLRKPTGSQIYFEDRIKSRLTQYYSGSVIQKFENKKIIFNNHTLTLTPAEIITFLQRHFAKPKRYYCAPCQADLLDLNLATKPVILDYLAAGWNPLVAEYAVFVWYQLCEADYMTPLYNPGAIKQHLGKTVPPIKAKLVGNKVTFPIRPIRKEAIKAFSKMSFEPAFKETGQLFEIMFEDFKAFFITKLLTRHSPANINPTATLVALCLAQSIFDLKPKSLKNFLSHIETI